MTKILWVSRHPPVPVQIDELKRIFGENTQIDTDPNPFSDAQDIVKRFKDGNYDEMVVVAPLSVIQHLTEMGIKPIWSEMKKVNDVFVPYTDSMANGRHYRFVRFRRIKRVKLDFEKLEVKQ